MAESSKKDTSFHDKKNKSGFANLKRKLNIPRIYKRLASKLSVHGRHIRSLTSNWTASDLQCLVSQYELSNMLKELSDAADLARPLLRSASEDLLKMQKEGLFCDLSLACLSSGGKGPVNADDCSKTIQVHSALLLKRLNLTSPLDDRAAVQGVPSDRPALTLRKAIGDKTAIVGALLDVIGGEQSSAIECEFDRDSRRFQLRSEHEIPRDLLTSLVRFVYGAKTNSPSSETQLSVSSATSFPALRPSENAMHSSNPIPSLYVESQSAVNSRTSDEPTDRKFREEFRHDMRDLFLSANITGDVKLLFAVSIYTSAFANYSRSRHSCSCFHCHSFVLSARSKFFRSIIQRHLDRAASRDDDASRFITIELDRKVLSQRYFPVVLYAMYTDELDLQRISKGVPSTATESLSVDVRDLMELFHIGRFLEFDALVQASEDALLNNLTVSNFAELLQWSSRGHGSSWLRRQAMRFARDNFQQLLANGTLYSLSSIEIAEVVSSDYVNSPELDILRAVLKWAEHELVRKLEHREPNLVRSHIVPNHSSRSFRMSSARRRELVMARHGDELHEVTASLLPFVRLRHILPANHEILNSAIKRGVISCPPDHLLDNHHRAPDDSCSWIRSKAGPDFCPPRLFAPYFSEVKAILKERLYQEASEKINSKAARRSASSPAHAVVQSVVPDALYMVRQDRQLSRQSSLRSSYSDKCALLRVGVSSMATKRLKYIDKTYPVPSAATASKLLGCERAIRQSTRVRKILHACHAASVAAPHCSCSSARSPLGETAANIQNAALCNLCRAESYIRLIVVREHGLSDVTGDILKRPHIYYDADELLAASVDATTAMIGEVSVKSRVDDSPRRLEKFFQSNSLSGKRYSPPREALNWNESRGSNSSDLSLSDDSSAEWPFPYRSGQMRDRNMPGNSFWDSDSSIKTPPMRSAVPDVAASADSTLRRSRRSRLTSSSSSDSCASVPCRLVAESLPPDQGADDDTGRRFYSGAYHSFSSSRKTSAPSYAHYLSLRKPSAGKRRPPLSNVPGLALVSVQHESPEISSSSPVGDTQHVNATPSPHLLKSTDASAVCTRRHLFSVGSNNDLKDLDLPETYT